LLLTSGLGTILIIKALDSNLDFFFTPSEIFAEDLPENKRIKVGGMVLEDSVERDGTNIVFQITDYEESIEVEFNGIVPDLFKEGSGVVVLGYLFEGSIKAEKVLAKHDENYMPPSLDIEK
jgi:cytochrome c-type biogenesis protein CcmE